MISVGVGQRRRRRANISPALGQRLVFDRLQIQSGGGKSMGDRFTA